MLVFGSTQTTLELHIQYSFFNMNKLLKWLVIIGSLMTFYGIFFSIEYVSVRKSEYVPTICQCLSATVTSRYCCDLKCFNSCTDVQPNLQNCKVLMSQSQSLSPDSCSQNS